MPSQERGPGPATIERVIAAWQRAQARLDEDDMLAGDEQVVNVAFPAEETGREQADMEVDGVLRRIVSAMLFASLRETEAADLAKAMTARRQRYESRGEMLRRALLDILLIVERQSFAAPEGTITVKSIPGSVVITEEADIPEDYMIERTTRTPDKAALRRDLAEGVVIPGASLSNGGYGLTFRRARAKPETV
ncbi:MAG TPA: siphovirus Gp157 family protein [Vicinamibacterales bacterium]|nr:siphovirus Gp157 family protein [Vicinamibacterales bacterium]